MIKKILAKIYHKIVQPPKKLSGFTISNYKFLLESQWWNEDKINEYQWAQLQKILDIAFNNVPFYMKYYKNAGVRREDIQSIADLSKLPIIDKHTVNQNRDQMINKDFTKDELVYATTGGSTAEPVGFYREKDKTKDLELAFALRKNSWFGYLPGEPRLVLEAKIKSNNNKNTLLYVDYQSNTIVVSYPDVNEENVIKLKSVIAKVKPVWIHGYPSALYIFSKKINNSPIKFSNLKGITSSSETLYGFQREFIEDVFQRPVFDHYGMSEMVLMASECEAHKGLHISPEYGIMELIDQNGNILKDKPGQIVGTGLQNLAMPLIRFNVGDIAEWEPEPCSCGRKFPLLKKIEGRVQDLLVTKDKRLISMTSINMHNNLFDNVIQYQFIQDIEGQALIKIIPLETYSTDDSQKILKTLSDLIGAEFKLQIDIVDNIPLTKLGKHRFLDQKLNVDKYLNG